MRLTLRKKIFFYTAVLIAGAIAIIFLILGRGIETDLRRFAENDLVKTRSVFRELEKARFDRLVSLANVIADVPILKAVVTTGDSATVVEAALIYQKTARSDLLIITDRTGRVLARAHNPAQYGDSLRDNPHVSNALKGEVVVGTLFHGDSLYQTVARPLTLRDQLLGTLVMGFRVGDPLATELHKMTGTEVAFILGPRILATSLQPENETELARLLKRGLRKAGKPSAGPIAAKPFELTLSGEPFLVLLEKVTESGTGKPVILSIMKSLRPSMAVRNSLGKNLLWMGLAFLVTAMGIAFFLSRTITGSLRSLLQGTRRISAGDLNQPIESDSRDEIGELARSFNRMMDDLKASRAQVEDYSRHLESKIEDAMDRLRESQHIILRSEKLASIGKLASGVAHEVLNPVNIIGMHSQSWLRETNIEPRLRKSFEVIDEQVHRTARITDGLRRFSRQTEPERNRIDLHDLLSETLHLVAHELRIRRIEVVQDLESNLPEVLGDKDQLAQVFLNLFTNARDAMPNGGRLSLRGRCGNHDGLMAAGVHRRGAGFGEKGLGNGDNRTVVISVEDTGEGIPEEMLSKIFDPFFTTKPVDKGTGLGLSISHSIIEAHSGEIQVQSRINEGTVISVCLPVGD